MHRGHRRGDGGHARPEGLVSKGFSEKTVRLLWFHRALPPGRRAALPPAGPLEETIPTVTAAALSSMNVTNWIDDHQLGRSGCELQPLGCASPQTTGCVEAGDSA